MDIINFDTEKLYLGKLCQLAHEWGTTGKTLRRKSNSECPECKKEKYRRELQENPEFNKKRYQAHREYQKNYQKQYRQKNAELIKQKQQQYRQKHQNELIVYSRNYYHEHRKSLLLKNREYRRKYYLDNKNKINSKHREYYRSNPEAANLRSKKRRAKKKTVHSVSYTPLETKALKETFENFCAYCGTKKPLALDHFIPLAKGGPDCLGNLVPACKSCNSSKHDSDPMEWYKLQPFYSIKRWKKILNVLGKKESNYAQLPLL